MSDLAQSTKSGRQRIFSGLVPRAMLASVVLLLGSSAFSVNAQVPVTSAFLALWQRTDLLVATGDVQRSWMWGDQILANPAVESYADAPGRIRMVQYYDKGRMEITDPQADSTSPWYITSGLLTRELISGKLQLGNDRFDDTGQPARIPIAGDPDNAFPTYADLGTWIDQPAPDLVGHAVTTAIARSGMSTYGGETGDSGTTISTYVTYAGAGGQQVGYNVPRAFWDFMNQSGPVYVDGKITPQSPLFQWQFLLGYPIGEAFWSQVALNGHAVWVMIQPFERRVLTYTPANAPNWRVEMGNIGQHYHTWRYQQLSTPVTPTAVELGDFYFTPSTLTVEPGTTVVWTMVGQRTNAVAADDGSWDSGDLIHGDLFTHEFDQPGVFHYHSRYYAWMSGTVVVQAGRP